MPSAAAIVLAGGASTRMGGGPNKPYLEAQGRPLYWYCLEAFVLAGVDVVVVVTRPEDRPVMPDRIRTAPGGPTRTASEQAGMAALDGVDVDIVLIHDAARPFVTPDLILRLVTTAATVGGAVPALEPAAPMWRRTPGGLTPAGSGLRRVQTPQAFRAAPLRTAYRQAAAVDAVSADTAEIVERFSDLEVAVVEGDALAFKVTRPEDVSRLEGAAAEWHDRVGRNGEG